MDEEFIGLYNKEEAKIISENTAYDNGKKEGLEQGKKENQIEIAKKMINKNMSIVDISEITNLTIGEIEKIQKEIELYNN